MTKTRFIVRSTDDVDKQKVDRREQKWIQYQPELTEDRAVILFAEFRARKFCDEGATTPELARIFTKWRQTFLIWLVYGDWLAHS